MDTFAWLGPPRPIALLRPVFSVLLFNLRSHSFLMLLNSCSLANNNEKRFSYCYSSPLPQCPSGEFLSVNCRGMKVAPALLPPPVLSTSVGPTGMHLHPKAEIMG